MNVEYFQTGDILWFKQTIKPLGKVVRGNLVHKGQNHHHTLKGGSFKIIDDNGQKYVIVTKNTIAVHEEHKDVKLSKGYYKISIVNEYDHLLEESRKVID